jgi:hypothetical protein
MTSANVNNNDMVTPTDIELFFSDFVSGESTAAVNEDGEIDAADVSTFFEAFGGAQ